MTTFSIYSFCPAKHYTTLFTRTQEDFTCMISKADKNAIEKFVLSPPEANSNPTIQNLVDSSKLLIAREKFLPLSFRPSSQLLTGHNSVSKYITDTNLS